MKVVHTITESLRVTIVCRLAHVGHTLVITFFEKAEPILSEGAFLLIRVFDIMIKRLVNNLVSSSFFATNDAIVKNENNDADLRSRIGHETYSNTIWKKGARAYKVFFQKSLSSW